MKLLDRVIKMFNAMGFLLKIISSPYARALRKNYNFKSQRDRPEYPLEILVVKEL